MPNLIDVLGQLIGGLALFLFGLELMSTGLKSVAGTRMQALLATLTASKLRGVLAGAGVTALLNSSTITTVLLVGFVSAGLMTLAQSIPMIMGANIGSTLTAQLIAFDLSGLAPFLMAVGFTLHAFARRETLQQLGGIVLGFGLLFLGIETMGDATRPLRTFQPFIEAMYNLSHPLLGILIGAAFTAIVQSSAATLAIVIALAGEGLIPLETAIALVLGANVGTCGTALLSGIGKSAEAVQVAVVHLLFNVLGVIAFALVIPQFADLVRWVSPSAPELSGLAQLAAETPRQVANAHTIFSVTNTVVLIWFSEPLARIARWIVPSRPGPHADTSGTPRYLDPKLLDVPALGIARVQLELLRVGRENLNLVQHGAEVATGAQKPDSRGHALHDEEVPDQLSTAILEYIGRLSEDTRDEREGQQIVDLAQIVMRLEEVREVAAINLKAVRDRQHGAIAHPAYLQSDTSLRFIEKVVANLERAIQLVGQPDDEIAKAIIADKRETDTLAVSASEQLMVGTPLRSREDVRNFRLASNSIEQFNEIARLSRAIARSTGRLDPVKVGKIDLPPEPGLGELKTA
ncbi:MAG TPA: Na/Pi cotransporter family protein [Paracoccus sp. (in: a-proteobacteria)]|uniref:Na/Pi cotransporter family protein n=1 Tax=Paracoccus sp. TaxID=267 RepID=UPI002BDD5195|nr:Na/Pi cotransporter family protein [Paracoccus sp. (in: a-proteobacteria)]HWL57020.1 Na/Pi cotransporter family protein [Paracoccus sp. (in: a-proteobacteria)]